MSRHDEHAWRASMERRERAQDLFASRFDSSFPPAVRTVPSMRWRPLLIAAPFGIAAWAGACWLVVQYLP